MTTMIAQEDLGIISMRIQENLKILSNFRQNRDPHKHRDEYVDELKSDLCKAYDYNKDMIDLIMDLFATSEVF